MNDNKNQSPNKRDEDELKKYKEEAEEYLNNWKKERADFLNYKKDEIKRLEEFTRFANEAVIMETIDIVDDLEKAEEQINNEGLRQIIDKFRNLLRKYGVERIKVEGKFNPLLHEAVAASSDLSAEALAEAGASSEGREGKEGDKIEEVRAGYTMHGQVVRPARVKIVK